MKTHQAFTVGLIFSALMVAGVNAQGLLGERYFGIDGGWERFENGVSDEGWGAGAELNAPFPMRRTGRSLSTDLNFRFDYRDVLDLDLMDAAGVLRAYVPPGEVGFTPFLGAGFGWLDLDVVDTTYVPAEVGAEIALGPMSVVPFFRYIFALDSAVEDYWTAGATGVWWIDRAWGFTVSGAYTDYDEMERTLGISNSLSARVGIVFAY